MAKKKRLQWPTHVGTTLCQKPWCNEFTRAHILQFYYFRRLLLVRARHTHMHPVHSGTEGHTTQNGIIHVVCALFVIASFRRWISDNHYYLAVTNKQLWILMLESHLYIFLFCAITIAVRINLQSTAYAEHTGRCIAFTQQSIDGMKRDKILSLCQLNIF